MSEEKYIWEDKKFNKNPFRVPDGYFDHLSDRILSRVNENPVESIKVSHRILRPWMVWVSSAAAVLIMGWFGFQNLYLRPHQEAVFQEGVSLFVDYYAQELHEGELANYIADHQIDLTTSSAVDYNYLIQIEPEMTEEMIYESVNF